MGNCFTRIEEKKDISQWVNNYYESNSWQISHPLNQKIITYIQKNVPSIPKDHDSIIFTFETHALEHLTHKFYFYLEDAFTVYVPVMFQQFSTTNYYTIISFISPQIYECVAKHLEATTTTTYSFSVRHAIALHYSEIEVRLGFNSSSSNRSDSERLISKFVNWMRPSHTPPYPQAAPRKIWLHFSAWLESTRYLPIPQINHLVEEYLTGPVLVWHPCRFVSDAFWVCFIPE